MGEGQGVLIEVNKEGIRRRGFEGSGGERWCHVRKSNVAGTIYRSRIEHAIKGWRKMLPLPLLRYWNSTTRFLV